MSEGESDSATATRRSGPVSAALIAAGLLGAVWLLTQLVGTQSTGPETEPTVSIPEAVVTWSEVEAGWVFAGPGGFLNLVDETAYYSPTGATWTELSLPGSEPHPIHAGASADAWVMSGSIGDDEPATWRSDDGEVWELVPAESAPTVSNLVSGINGGFAIQSESELWTSFDGGRTWTRPDAVGLQNLIPSSLPADSFVASGRSTTQRWGTFLSATGKTWTELIHPVAEVGDAVIGDAAPLRGSWLVTGEISPPRDQIYMWWLDPQADRWIEVALPAEDIAFTQHHQALDGDYFYLSVARSGRTTIWRTEDAEEWVQVGSLPVEVDTMVVRGEFGVYITKPTLQEITDATDSSPFDTDTTVP